MLFHDLAPVPVPEDDEEGAPPLVQGDPASAAAGAIEKQTGSHAAGIAGAAAVGFIMRGWLGAAAGAGIAHFLKKKPAQGGK